MFVGVHAALANVSGIKEFQIDPQEGDDFMKSAQNVMRHYSVETTQKTLDWLAFCGTVSQMYGLRLIAYNVRKKAEEKERQDANAHGAGHVVPLHGIINPQ